MTGPRPHEGQHPDGRLVHLDSPADADQRGLAWCHCLQSADDLDAEDVAQHEDEDEGWSL